MLKRGPLQFEQVRREKKSSARGDGVNPQMGSNGEISKGAFGAAGGVYAAGKTYYKREVRGPS